MGADERQPTPSAPAPRKGSSRYRRTPEPMTNPHFPPAEPTFTLLPEPSVSTPSTPSHLLDEIRILRERGLTDDCIHGLLRGFDIDSHTLPTADHSKHALTDQLIRLIWGTPASANAASLSAD